MCISSGKINYLIPATQVEAALYCSDESCFLNGKFLYKNRALPYLNFYNEITDDDALDVLYTDLALIIRNSKLFEHVKEFALIISSECTVKNLKYKDFSIFSDRLSVVLKKKGYIACYFKNNEIYYLIDIEDFLKNFIV